MSAVIRAFLGVAMLYGLSVPASGSLSKTPVADLPEKGLFTAVAVDGKLYAFRFENDDAPGADRLGSAVYAYNFGADKWEGRAAMPVAKASYGMIALGGRVYVMGGITAAGRFSGSVEI